MTSLLNNINDIKKKKKPAHAYFRAPYFSKSFGGKIFRIWTDVTYRTNFFKKRRTRIVSTVFFFLVFGGKIQNF